jgi:hypothetical protein
VARSLVNYVSPKEVISLNDATIIKVTLESTKSITEREGLEKQLETLEHSLKTLQRMKIR